MSFRKHVKTYAKERLREQYGTVLGGLILATLPALFFSGIQSGITAFIQFFGNSAYFTASVPLFFLLALCGISVVLSLGAIFLIPFQEPGCAALCLTVAHREQASALTPYKIGAQRYLRKLGGMLWMSLFTFLWSLLFIIPGIVKAYSYRFTPYILADCPDVTARDALKLSMKMTDGIKGELFVFDLSYIGWWFLTAITGGLLGIYTMPYYSVAFAVLFESMKENALASGRVSHEELYPTVNAPSAFSMPPLFHQ